MKDRISSVCKEHLDASGEFQWPADMAARNRLASRLLGACVVAKMDYWTEKALRTLEAELPVDQQQKLRRLLFDTVDGVVFSILAKLDQFPFANLDIVLSDVETQESIASVGDGDIFDFHDRLAGWIEKFSDYPEEFLHPNHPTSPRKEG